MRRFFTFTLAMLILLLAPSAFASEYSGYEEYTYQSITYTIPDALETTISSDDKFVIHAVDSSSYVTVMFIPIDNVDLYCSSDAMFCDACMAIQGSTYSDDTPISDPALFPVSDGFLASAAIFSENEAYFYTATADGMVIIKTDGYSDSADIRLAFTQIIASLSVV